MNVASILSEKGSTVVTVEAGDTVLHALKVLKEHRIGAVLVMGDKGRIGGVLSERDVVRALPGRGDKLLEDEVSTLMTRDVITCAPDDSVNDVLAKMTQRRIRHLPVLDGKKLIGVISIGDAVKARIADVEHEAEALKQYIVSG